MNSRYTYRKKKIQQASKKARLDLKLICCQKNVNKARD